MQSDLLVTQLHKKHQVWATLRFGKSGYCFFILWFQNLEKHGLRKKLRAKKALIPSKQKHFGVVFWMVFYFEIIQQRNKVFLRCWDA